MDTLSVVVGLLVGAVTVIAFVAAFGKWMLKAVVKEVLSEVSGNWVPSTTGTAMSERIARLERQFDDFLKSLAAVYKGA